MRVQNYWKAQHPIPHMREWDKLYSPKLLKGATFHLWTCLGMSELNLLRVQVPWYYNTSHLSTMNYYQLCSLLLNNLILVASWRNNMEQLIVTTCNPHPYFCKTSPNSLQCETSHWGSKEEIKLLYMFCLSKHTILNITIYCNASDWNTSMEHIKAHFPHIFNLDIHKFPSNLPCTLSCNANDIIF